MHRDSMCQSRDMTGCSISLSVLAMTQMECCSKLALSYYQHFGIYHGCVVFGSEVAGGISKESESSLSGPKWGAGDLKEGKKGEKKR